MVRDYEKAGIFAPISFSLLVPAFSAPLPRGDSTRDFCTPVSPWRTWRTFREDFFRCKDARRRLSPPPVHPRSAGLREKIPHISRREGACASRAAKKPPVFPAGRKSRGEFPTGFEGCGVRRHFTAIQKLARLCGGSVMGTDSLFVVAAATRPATASKGNRQNASGPSTRAAQRANACALASSRRGD